MKDSAVGRPIIIRNDNEGLLNQNLVKLSAKESFDSKFIYNSLLDIRYINYIATIERGNANQANIAIADLWEYPIKVPRLNEQQKIGAFLKSLDNTITLHQRKLDQLKDLKQAYLQQLFPSDGEYAPKVRFANFNRDWELCKLNKLANIIGGGTPSTGVEEYWNGDIDWYSPVEIGSQIFLRGSQKKITEVGLQKSSAKVLPVGTVLFTSRAGIGNTAILAKEGTTNQGFQSIVPHSGKLDTYFIYSRTHELKQYGEITGAGSTFIEVSGKQMAKMPIKVPRFEEQAKIGSFFKKLDDIITLHQQKLSKLERLKSAYLQKMFI